MSLPWQSYCEHQPVSRFGITLVAAFSKLMAARWDSDQHEIHAFFVQNGGTTVDKDPFVGMAMISAEMMLEAFQRGDIATFARPIGGGAPVTIPADLWEVDDPLARLATGLFNLSDWSNHEAEPTHRIFVDNGALSAWIANFYTLDEIDSLLDGKPVRRRLKPAPAPAASWSDAVHEPPPAAEAEPRILRIKEVIALTGRSHSSIYADIEEGTFPQQLKLGARASGWFEHEILEWCRKRPRGRSVAPSPARIEEAINCRNILCDQAGPDDRQLTAALHICRTVVSQFGFGQPDRSMSKHQVDDQAIDDEPIVSIGTPFT